MHNIYHNRSPMNRKDIFNNEEPQTDGVTTRLASQNEIRVDVWSKWNNTLLVQRNRDTWNSIPREIRESRNRDDFKSYVREQVLEKLQCNQIRLDFISGHLRELAIKHQKHLDKARLVSNFNQQIGNMSKSKPNDFLLDDEFKDDFLKPDLCLKKMKRRNVAKIKQLAKIAPHMLLCKCNAKQCLQEVEDYERTHGSLRLLPRVVIVDDKVIMKDRLLMNTVKKITDFFETDGNLFYD